MSEWPSVKVVLKKNALLDIVQNYDNLLSGSSTKEFKISVRAEGISNNLILQTDQGVFNGTQEVLPFGAVAPTGARFYVGFAEAFLKKIDTMTLRPNWVEPFADSAELNSYYGGYPPGRSTATSIAVLNNNTFEELISQDLDFVNDSPDASNADRDSLKLTFAPTLAARDIDPKYSFTQYDPSIRRGFVRLTFNGELFHKEYAEILALAMINTDANAALTTSITAITNGINALEDGASLSKDELINLLNSNPGTNLPNLPYTPTFNSMELDYVSEGQELQEDVDQFIYLHPFGGYERATWPASVTDPSASNTTFNEVTLFKDFTGTKKVNKTSYRGHLYLGFSQLAGGSSLSLLVQTVEGSEKKPDVDPPTIRWHFLAKNNTWTSIPSDKILLDSTRGLTQSGIIQLGIPSAISSEGNTILNPNLYWLRVTADEEVGDNLRLTAALPDLAYIKAQVIEARFNNDQENDFSHLAEGQPDGSITKLAVSQSAIKKIEQPFATFDGRLPETAGMSFYLRISERLRHRDRAVTVWDYEHLLMQDFLDVATAKCIPHTQYHTIPESELTPGSVVVAVIPELARRQGFSRNQPRFPKGYLDDMRDFLLARTTMFLHGKDETSNPTLYVTNGQYEQIKVQVAVVFNDDIADEEFFKLQLNKDLRHFLSPWIEGSEAPCFGSPIRRSQIIHFIEQRSYINYIDIESFTIYKDEIEQTSEHIKPSADHGILCSDSSHIVDKYPNP
jgi:hypothetical protein